MTIETGYRVPAIFRLSTSRDATLDPEGTRELAQALAEGAGEENSDSDAIGLYLASAQYSFSLGLNEEAAQALQSASQRAGNFPSGIECMQAYLQIAAGYQSAGMIEDANRAFTWISFIGENNEDPQIHSLALLAQTFWHLNGGEFEAAQESLSHLPESETTLALAEEIREGSRRARVIQNLQIFQSMIFLYSETHPFAEGVDRAAVRSELLAALESAAHSALSGEQPDLWKGLRRYYCAMNFLFDTPQGRGLESLSDPALDRREYRYRWLNMTDRFMEESDYASAGLMAQLMLELPEMREHGEVYNSRIEYHTSRLAMRRSGANLVGDWLTNLGTGLLDSGRNFLSFMTLGALGGSLEENLAGTAEIALLIVTEGISLEAESLFAASRISRGLHPLASRALGWGVRSGISALAFSAGGLAIEAATTRSLERLTVREFSREFGANMVMFGLLHLAGRAGNYFPVPVRYATAVSSFVASDYLNEGLGLRDSLDLPVANRLLNAVSMDARIRFANWLGTRITAGRFERLRTMIAERYAEQSREYRLRFPARRDPLRSLGRAVYDANLILATLLLGGVPVMGGGGSSGRTSSLSSYDLASRTLHTTTGPIHDYRVPTFGRDEVIPALRRFGLDPESERELSNAVEGNPFGIDMYFEVSPHSNPSEIDALWHSDFSDVVFRQIQNIRNSSYYRIGEGDSIILNLWFRRGRVRTSIIAVLNPEFYTTEGAIRDLFVGNGPPHLRFYRRFEGREDNLPIPWVGGNSIPEGSDPVQIISPLIPDGLGELRLAPGTRRVVIGRDHGHFTSENSISREHATLELREDGRWYIRDGVISSDGSARYSRNGVGLHSFSREFRLLPRETGNPASEWLPISDGEVIYFGQRHPYIFHPPRASM